MPHHIMLVFKFFIGLSTRMGQMHKPNLGLSVELVVGVVGAVRNELKETEEKNERFELIVFRAHAVLRCVLSLRGTEVLTLDLTGL